MLSKLLVAVCSAGLLTPATASDWFRWRGPDLNGVSKETGWSATWPKEGPKQIWKASVGTGFSSISVANGRAYTAGNRNNADTIYCFEAATGAFVWKHDYPSPLADHYYDGGASATPTVDGQTVFFLGKQGDLLSLDAATGKVNWARNAAKELGAKVPEWGFASSPVVEGELLLLNVGSAGVAVDKATGKVVWSSGRGPAGYSSAVPFDQAGRRCAALFVAEAVVAVDAKTGKELWQHPWDTSYDANIADPILSGSQVFISSGYNKGCALLQVSGDRPSVLWQNKNMRNHFNSCVLVDGFLYGFDDDYLRCLDFKTGLVKWTDKTLGKGALMAADGKLIIQGEKGLLVIAEANPTTYKPLARAQVLGVRCWTTPVLSNGRIYCRNAKGDVVCLDVKAAAAQK
jgi:outer membrane protein assembly factor BamB